MSALVVERNTRIGHLIASGLRANGYDATCTRSAAEAELLLQSRSYDLTIIDPEFPPLQASRLLRALRTAPVAQLIVIARSEYDVERVVVDDLVVDRPARRCFLAGRAVSLRRKEFDVLNLLAGHRDRLVSRAELISQIWDEHWRGSTKTLDVTIAGVRRRLREAAADADAKTVRMPQISAVRGLGYRLISEAGAAPVGHR
jgi:DNA-binding response OmpR family regulator